MMWLVKFFLGHQLGKQKKERKNHVFVPILFATRVHTQEKDNGLILALHVLFLNLGQLNFRQSK